MKKKKKRKKGFMVVLQERELSTEKMVRDAWCCEYREDQAITSALSLAT